MYILFLHSFINENLENFHLLAIVNDAAINMWVHVSLGDPAFNSLGVHTQKWNGWIIR